jgi:diacylglycerol kinase family enzyme
MRRFDSPSTSKVNWLAVRCTRRLEQSELAKLAKVHITTKVRLEGFDAHVVRGQSGTISAVVNALAKAGVELGENGTVIPRPKGNR